MSTNLILLIVLAVAMFGLASFALWRQYRWDAPHRVAEAEKRRHEAILRAAIEANNSRRGN